MTHQDRIHTIFEHALEARLFGREARARLLAVVPARIAAELDEFIKPADQLRADVTALDAMPLKGDPCLALWLDAAAALSEDPWFAAQAEVIRGMHPKAGVRVRWRFAPHTPQLGEVILPPEGGPYLLGRRHPEPPDRFVELTSASHRVSPVHVAIEATDGGLIIRRWPGAGVMRIGDERIGTAGEHQAPSGTARLTLAGALDVLIEVN